jgi:hypothetical protein
MDDEEDAGCRIRGAGKAFPFGTLPPVSRILHPCLANIFQSHQQSLRTTSHHERRSHRSYEAVLGQLGQHFRRRAIVIVEEDYCEASEEVAQEGRQVER